MLVRLLPQDGQSAIAHELACMEQPSPAPIPAGGQQQLTGKLIGLPVETATLLTGWLHQQVPGSWWYSAPGASVTSVDLLFRAPDNLLALLRQALAQTPCLQAVVTALEQALRCQESAPAHLWLGDRQLALGQRTYVMGILNVTPDSFSDGGLYLQPEQAIKHAEEMLVDGADLIDVGGQSSRPGAIPIPEEVEHHRVIPVIREVVQRYGALVSVDTYRASIAEAALDAGAVLINDISAMRFDAQMAPLIARRQAAVVLMHMQGTPQTMQHAPAYHHVIDDVYGFLAARLHDAMQHGIARQRIVLDPGFGFGKTVHHNLTLLRGLEHFQALGQPLLVGTSRKSFLGRLLQREVWDRLEGTLVSVVYATLRGAAIVRVHDVKPVVQAVRVLDALEKSPSPCAPEP
jgi:dihydropteroate synthase